MMAWTQLSRRHQVQRQLSYVNAFHPQLISEFQRSFWRCTHTIKSSAAQRLGLKVSNLCYYHNHCFYSYKRNMTVLLSHLIYYLYPTKKL